ncbi:MAG: hypothetical protein ONB31_07750 [candidate division KSB1 bacterium]|nr:hypothetical protein [candidate division KSB1 bacterium]MDZ7335674.1 hypothetical protein [candidate division KSB1 bacterium]MDZ7357707.1 hypothetical protein [candidate division KSB1 bacterium]MDZ7402051.1 hypothetical protein [candidate division KSB1 bacterium]
MDDIIHLSTQNVMQMLFGIPENHKHCRLVLKTEQAATLVFSEALVAAIVRAYVTVKTHPTQGGLEMTSQPISNGKADFATWQLLETDKSDNEIQREISSYLTKS